MTEEQKNQTQSEPDRGVANRDSFFEMNRNDGSYDSFVNLEKAVMNDEYQSVKSDDKSVSYRGPSKTEEPSSKPSASQFKTTQSNLKQNELAPSAKDKEQSSKNIADTGMSKQEREYRGVSKDNTLQSPQKTADKEQQRARQVSLSPSEGIDDGMQLKHFKKSKLFQKFMKETTEKPKTGQANINPKQKSSSKSPMKGATRPRTDENNTGQAKTNTSEVNAKPRKVSPGQEKYATRLESEEDSVLVGRDHQLSRSRMYLGLDHSQSFNLNYHSASQYLPMNALSQSANYSGLLGVAPHLGPIVEEPSRNLLADNKLITESSDLFLLKTKLLETTKALERESETNKVSS